MAAATVGTFLVFLIILVALVLFVIEPVPIDVIAIGFLNSAVIILWEILTGIIG